MKHSTSFVVTFETDTKLSSDEANSLIASFSQAIDRELDMAGIAPLAEYSIEAVQIKLLEGDGE